VPSFREGKVERGAQWLAERGLDLSWGGGDLLFGLHQRPGAAGKGRPPGGNQPDERLRAVAHERGWRILDLFKEK
jgi:phosphoserine phosphatase